MVFQKAIAKADPAETVSGRVSNLIDCISFSVFQYTTRGLFESDKLIFTSQMTFQVISRTAFYIRSIFLINADPSDEPRNPHNGLGLSFKIPH